MSTGQMQVRNAELVRLLSGDLQLRYEPNFAWKSAVSAYLALPALRAFWPMSSVDYAAASRARDISGSGYHLTDNNTPTFNCDSLAPYVEFDGTNQYLSRADGGAATEFDILGTESYIDSSIRGLTLGCWCWIDAFPGVGVFEYIMGKWSPYSIQTDGVANIRFWTWDAVNGNQSATTTTTSGTWIHVVGRFDPSVDRSIFVNGVETAHALNVPASLADTANNFVIGANSPGADNYFDGRVSLAFLCAAMLSDTIILSLFHQTRAMFGV